MKAEIMTITPEMAVEMLKRNVNNRKISNNYVVQLVHDLKNGDFLTNGDAIRFNKEGVLVDGQHRLTAVAISKVPITAVVVTELDDSAVQTVDTGKKRNFSAIATIAGKPDWECSTKMATLAKTLLVLFGGSKYASKYITNAELMRLMEENASAFRLAHKIATKKFRGKRLTSMLDVIAVLSVMAAGEPAELVDVFLRAYVANDVPVDCKGRRLNFTTVLDAAKNKIYTRGGEKAAYTLRVAQTENAYYCFSHGVMRRRLNADARKFSYPTTLGTVLSVPEDYMDSAWGETTT